MNFAEVLLSDGTAMSMSLHLLSFLSLSGLLAFTIIIIIIFINIIIIIIIINYNP